MSKPYVGQPATFSPFSDCYPCTVIEVSKNEKTIVVQYDQATIVSGSAFNGTAQYEITRDEAGRTETYSLRKCGKWVEVGVGTKGSGRLTLGVARRYYDPHF